MEDQFPTTNINLLDDYEDDDDDDDDNNNNNLKRPVDNRKMD